MHSYNFSDNPKGWVLWNAKQCTVKQENIDQGNVMIYAAHIVFSCYGFWLPNDERGSWSDFVRSYELFRKYGPATKINTPRSVAHESFDVERRDEARLSLKYPSVELTGLQALSVAKGFAAHVLKSGYTLYAFAMLPGHGHIVLQRHRYDFVQMMNLLKGAATRQLEADGVHPLLEFRRDDGSLPSPWASRCWKVFLNDDDDVRGAIEYVEDNPVKEGKPPQKWSFVTRYASR